VPGMHQPEVSCDDVCHICAEFLIVKEVQRQAPGCLAEERAAWSREAEADTQVVSWISCCLESVRGAVWRASGELSGERQGRC